MERDAALAARIRDCRACPLGSLRTNATPAYPGSDYRPGGLALMIEAPRQSEDRSGVPLSVGAGYRGRPNEGAIVNQMLAAAGIDRAAIMVLARVRCQPTRNRLLDFPEALANCEPWNVEEFALYQPGLVILMGNNAMRPVFGAKALITHVRGTYRTTGERFQWGARTWTATFHPSMVLHDETLTRDVVADLVRAKEMLQEVPL